MRFCLSARWKRIGKAIITKLATYIWLTVKYNFYNWQGVEHPPLQMCNEELFPDPNQNPHRPW